LGLAEMKALKTDLLFANELIVDTIESVKLDTFQEFNKNLI
jgi:hypothetical protein